MKEEFLHYLWKNKMFFPGSLKTLDYKSIEVRQPGLHNKNAGPDFLGARVLVEGIEWCGDVEIHIRTSDFYLHKHQHDPAYDKLLMHVVYEHDTIFTNDVFTCVVKDCFDPGLLNHYRDIFLHKNPLACSGLLKTITELTWYSWLDRMLFERIENLHETSAHILHGQQFNTEEAFYVMLAAAFGFQINRRAFELLTLQTPYRLLLQHRDNPIQVEAILMGQAGILDNEFEDEYLRLLQNEYVFLHHKYKLKKPTGIQWNYLRLRPGNFPCIRISQLAGLICAHERLYETLTQSQTPEELRNHLHVKAADYWDSHYLPDKSSVDSARWLGKSSKEGIILNAVVPFLFLAGTRKKEPDMVMRAYHLLGLLGAEDNKTTRFFSDCGKSPRHAGDSQAIKHLYDNYCTKRQCLECAVGRHIIAG